MTIAISMKVNDGVVLASDSAASIIEKAPGRQHISIANIYEHAEKVFNLCKGEPVGAITWGSGSIGNASTATLMKDFRKEIGQELASNQYSIEQIASRLADFMFKDKYVPAYEDWDPKPNIGFMVSGYSKNHDFAEEWKFDINNGNLNGPIQMRGEDETGLTWNGEPEAITRLYLGFGTGLVPALVDMGYNQQEAEKIQQGLRQRLIAPMVIPPMPIQDAINLANFLVETTVNFHKFAPGAPTVGGPIDIATITKHEGFKWVQRKHYYSADLNPLPKE